MIVPQFWAEARAHQTRTRERPQITVRRFGWSDRSQEDAQAMADTRAREALTRLASGEKLLRREPKLGYNGAEGVPIREEVLERHGTAVITRNSYGARCLNTPDVVFADIDFETAPGVAAILAHGVMLVLVAAGLAAWLRSGWLVVLFAFLVLVGAQPFAVVTKKLRVRASGGAEKLALRRVRAFAARHPDWSFRIYRTPAGCRVMVTQATFSPRDRSVTEFFTALGVDPIYRRMCVNQNCFRARLSPKPWRIGISNHLRPRPGVWPVSAAGLPVREAWVRTYEQAAADFAACRFVEEIGSGIVAPEVARVVRLHDERSGALSGRTIA